MNYLPRSIRWDAFDLSGVQEPDDLDRILEFVEVSTIGEGDSFFVGSLNVASGGSYPTATASLIIDVAVGESFTVEYKVVFKALPEDFNDVAQGVATGRHVFLGVWSGQDYAVGFFISKQGFAYTGEAVFDLAGDLIPAQIVEQVSDSADWVLEGIEYIVRLVLNAETQTLYVYVTPTAELAGGLTLKAILTAKATTGAGTDAAVISVHGTVPEGAWVELLDYKLSSKVLLPDLPPVADAGDDQAILRCSILQLNGERSLDPEGAALSFEWRLIDAPLESMFVFAGGDGHTLAEFPPTGFTDKFYSTELEEVDVQEPVQIGDVLTCTMGSFTIKEVTRTPGFVVRIEYSQLIESKSNIIFRLLRQNGINTPSSAKPTFYPDKLGFYAFDLRVNDGTSSSDPLGTNRSKVLINVLESPLPRACSIDASFIFRYLLSFWSQVEDRDKIAVFWEALARTASTELFTLWQAEYSKSLRDIQRVFVRRWLHFDTLLPEPVPELTSIRFLWGGVTSNSISAEGLTGVAGSVLVVSSPFLADAVALPLVGPGLVSPVMYAKEVQARVRELLGPSAQASAVWTRPELFTINPIGSFSYPGALEGRALIVEVDGAPAVTATINDATTPALFIAKLQKLLPTASITLTIEGFLRIASKTVGGGKVSASIVINSNSTLLIGNGGPLAFGSLSAAPRAYVHVTANIPFTFTTLSTAPGFSYPQVNGLLGAASGARKVGVRTLQVPKSLQGIPLKEDDLLVLGLTTYRVVHALDSADDTLPLQRVVVKEDLLDVVDAEWIIPGWVKSEFLDFWGGLVDRGDHVDFEVVRPVEDQFVTTLVSTDALGVNKTSADRLAIDSAQLAGQLSLDPRATTHLARVIRRRFIPVDPLIVDVPVLASTIEIEDPEEVLHRSVDFFLEKHRGRQALRFSCGVGTDLGDVWENARPPQRLWAEYTYVNNEPIIEANFGAPIDLTRDKVPSTVDYLSAVRGIWYALYNGPRLQNLRIALQIFLGLPFAEEPGIIEEIRTDFFAQRGRILIRDNENQEIVRSYVYPIVLSVETNPNTKAKYKVGDFVEQFAPLVTGAEIIDWVKDPDWFVGILNQGVFSEVQKYHSFLVRVASQAFDLESLLFAQRFIKKIKPTYTDPLYVVSYVVAGDGDEIDVIDDITFNVKLHLYDTPCDRLGASVKFDEPWAAGAAEGESWRNDFDEDDDPGTTPPGYPGPPDLVAWGFDKEWLCPEDQVEAEGCLEFIGQVPTYDSVFAFDQSLTSQEFVAPVFSGTYVATLSLLTTTYAGTIKKFSVLLNGPTDGPNVDEPDWLLELLLDGSVVATVPFSIGYIHPILGFILTMPQNLELISTVLSVPILVGQQIALRVRPSNVVEQETGWTQILVAIAIDRGVWQWDELLPDGVYCALRTLV